MLQLRPPIAFVAGVAQHRHPTRDANGHDSRIDAAANSVYRKGGTVVPEYHAGAVLSSGARELSIGSHQGFVGNQGCEYGYAHEFENSFAGRTTGAHFHPPWNHARPPPEHDQRTPVQSNFRSVHASIAGANL